jgi:phosphonate transport system substrate-binding protein
MSAGGRLTNRRTPALPKYRRSVAALLLTVASSLCAPAVQAADDALTMGVFPRRNPADTQKAFSPMSELLAKRLGRNVRLVTFKDFESFWNAVRDHRFDIVHYNQYHFIRSEKDYRVIAHIEEFGRSTIAGVIYVRKDSGITELTQLRGRQIMFGGGEDAMISYIATSYLLMRAGLKKNDFKPLFAVNPPNAIVALTHRQADAAGAGDGIADLPEVMSAIKSYELTPLAVSPSLLQLPIAVRRNMPPELRNSIQAVLIDLKNSPQGWKVLKSAGLTGLGKADDKDYEPHRKMVNEVTGGSGNSNKPAARGAKPVSLER